MMNLEKKTHTRNNLIYYIMDFAAAKKLFRMHMYTTSRRPVSVTALQSTCILNQ